MIGLRPLARIAAQPRQSISQRCSPPHGLGIPPLRQRTRASFATKEQLSSHARQRRRVDAVGKRGKARSGLVTVASIGAVGLLGYLALNYTKGGKFVTSTVDRSSRVIYTLAVCVRDYRETLKQRPSHSESQWQDILKACHKRCAERTLEAMKKNGSIFIKLGQHLTSLNYLLPSEWCDTFIPLQDHCPVTSFASIKSMVEGDIGMAFTDIFSEFDQEPLGAASLAQVHRAVDKASGQQVAVKVQHPVLDEWAPLDLSLTRFTFSTIKWWFPEYDLTWLSDEMQVSLPQELDFALEGENAMRTREYFADIKDCPLIIPNVLWAKRRILTMEYLTGHRIDDLDYLNKHDISRDEVSASLARIFNTMIFAPSAPLHCDPHGGNIAIIPEPTRRPPNNFSIILYDHGLYRTIPRDTQRSYAKLWLAVLDGDEKGMRQHAYDCAGITDEQFPIFASAITGRDYRVVSSKSVDQPRTAGEKEKLANALNEGLLQQLVSLLASLPRIMLLVLKTNDLTRGLDTNLQTRQGPMRSFLILARYAAATVLDEQTELLRETGGLLWPPGNAARYLSAWLKYARVVFRLRVYESVLYVRGLVGLDNSMPGGALGG